MGKQIGWLTAILVLWAAVNVRATIIELPLDCAGTYNVGQGGPADSWETNFDFGVEFTDISHVYIDWEGEMTASLAIFLPKPDEIVPVDSGISAVLGKYPSYRHVHVGKGELTYPDPESFNIRTEFIYGSMHLSELYDGKGRINIGYSLPALLTGTYVDYGQVTLNNASLIIDGTLIPEPTTITILVFGILGMRLRRKYI